MSTWLFDSLLVTSILLTVILLIRRPVAKAFGPGIAYLLWLLPAARLLVPSISVPAPAPVEGAQGVRDAVREAVLAGVPASDAVVTASGAIVAPMLDWTALAITLWLGGAAVMFVVQMIRYASMRDELLADAEELGDIDGVRLVASDRVGGPLAFGLFHRYIAVPQDFTRAYPPAERELAIAHEMAHHKSGDLFANLAAFTFLCLQWFNPLAWMSWNAFRFDQEAACDARVLAGKDSAARQAYGRALARTAFDGVPTFATALNSPKTILERLRRLTMKDASKQRQSMGKIALFAAAAIVLPLSATFVPVALNAEDEQAEDAPKVEKKVKIIKIKHGDKDGDVQVFTGPEGKGKHVKKIERDGKTFVFHTDKILSEAEVEQMIAKAEASRGAAEAAAEGAEIARGHSEEARKEADKIRVIAMRRVEDMDIASMIPEIDIKEITKNCKDGTPVTTDVEGFDGSSKARVKIVMCGKGHAKVARLEAVKGLREALVEIERDEEIPEKVRAQIRVKLEKEAAQLEAQADADKD